MLKLLTNLTGMIHVQLNKEKYIPKCEAKSSQPTSDISLQTKNSGGTRLHGPCCTAHLQPAELPSARTYFLLNISETLELFCGIY